MPVIAPLRKLLDAHNATYNGAVWMFQGEKNKFSLNLDNLTGREIRPLPGDRWQGWHAFRRRIATVLFGLGVDADAEAAATQRLEKSLSGKGQLRGKQKPLDSRERTVPA